MYFEYICYELPLKCVHYFEYVSLFKFLFFNAYANYQTKPAC